MPLIAFACQSQPTDNTAVATATQAIQNTNITLTYLLPSAWTAEKAVIVGVERVEIASRAKIVGTNAAIIALGTESLRVGSGAQVPDIWVKGGVTLANDSTVNGSIESGVTATVGTNVKITGTKTVRTGNPSITARTVSLDFGLCNNNIMVEPGQSREISAGFWGDVYVKRGSTLHVSPGGYSLRSLAVEPGGSIVVHSDGSSVNFAVQNNVTFRGAITYPYTKADLNLTVVGSDVTIDSTLKATIIAPNARVAVNYKVSPFIGRIYDRDVYIAPEVTVNHYVPSTGAFDPVDTPAPTLEEMNLPTTAGAPPNLGDATVATALRAENFITWVQRSTESDLAAGRDEIAKIRTDNAVNSALVDATWSAINAKKLSRALVALEVLAELDTDESETLFNTLVAQSAPGTGTWITEDRMTVDDRAHVMLQAKAVLGLGWRRTVTAKATLKTIAVSHPSELVRTEAIRVYVLYFGPQGRAELAAVLPANTQGRLDTFESTDADGRRYAVREAEYVTKHPEAVMVTVPTEPMESPDNANMCSVDNEED